MEIKERKKPKYTPLSQRHDRPDAILWLCKNASELTDGQISKLVGSTKGTVSLIRKRSYWNFSNLKPRDPVILALCTQEVFEKSLAKAKRIIEREKPDLILPTGEEDLEFLSQFKSSFMNTKSMIQLCQDKYLFYKHFKKDYD